MKRKILAMLLVASLMMGGISCFCVSANEDTNIQNENTIKYIKSEEGYDYGNSIISFVLLHYSSYVF